MTTRAAPSRARWLVLVLLSTCAWFAGSGRAAAHAELVATSPEAGSVLDDSPAQIVLTFTEAVDAVEGSIRLVAADGSDIGLPAAGRLLGPDTLSTTVPPLADGTYVVAWRAISADSHPIGGAFTFSVGVQTATAPGLIERLVDEDATSDGTQIWLGVGRWASFAGIAVLIGALLTLARCAPDVLAARRTTIVLLAAALTALVGTAVMIVAQGTIVSGGDIDPSSWSDVAATTSGQWWAVRLAILLLAVAMVLTGRHRRRGPEGFGGPTIAVTVLACTALLAVVVAGGHGVTGRMQALGFLASWVHVAAMCAWVGGLVGLALLVGTGSVRSAASRFSPIALGSVAALAITGSINAWRQSDSWSALRDSSYGRWLLVKLVVVVGVVAMAGVSRWLASESADTGAGTRSAGEVDDPTSRAMHRVVRLEVAGMVLVLAMTAGLVESPPPRAEELGPVTVSAVEGDRIAQVVLDPPVTGGTTMHVYVTSTTGTLVKPIATTVTASLPSAGIEQLDLPLIEEAPGHLSSDAVVLPIAGVWTFTIRVRYSEFDQVQFTVEAEVR